MDDFISRVPTELHARFREVVGLTDAYCKAHLNPEYRDLCRELAVQAFRAGVPVTTGKAAGWAAGVVAAVAYANFLGSDPNQKFHTPPGEMAKGLGVSLATMNNRSKAIRDALGIERADTRFSTKELNDKNPIPEMMELFTRMAAAMPEPPPPARRGKKVKPKAKPSGPAKVYTLDVMLLQGPITKAFAKKNKSVVRTIEIRGDQTLEDLHWAIYDAFDRDDPHMYEFQMGKGPMDPKGPRYIMPEADHDGMEDQLGPPIAGITDETTIDDMGLKVGRRFGYWFDFGDDWHHQINVEAISDGPPKGKYPRVTKRVGESPPQYVDWDEEEE